MKVTIKKIVSGLVLVGILGFSACSPSANDYTNKQLLTILNKSQSLKTELIQAYKSKNTEQIKSTTLAMEKMRIKIEPYYKSAKKAYLDNVSKIYANLSNESKEKELNKLDKELNRKRYLSLGILDNLKKARENIK